MIKRELKEENLSLCLLLLSVPCLYSSLNFLGCPQAPPTFYGEGSGAEPTSARPSRVCSRQCGGERPCVHQPLPAKSLRKLYSLLQHPGPVLTPHSQASFRPKPGARSPQGVPGSSSSFFTKALLSWEPTLPDTRPNVSCVLVSGQSLSAMGRGPSDRRATAGPGESEASKTPSVQN